jgi:hypothetical protein
MSDGQKVVCCLLLCAQIPLSIVGFCRDLSSSYLVCCPKESAERKWKITSFRRSPRHLRRDNVLAGEIGALARFLRARTVSRDAYSVLVCTSRSVSIGVEDFGNGD